jgi:hypothetical protein
VKKAILIIVVVTGYALLEAALLLGVMVPQKWDALPTRYQATVSLAQLLLIPGMAALFSRVVYGSYQWRRRTLTILLVGALGVPASIALFMLMVALLFWASDVNTILFAFLLPVALGTLVFTAYWCVKKRGRWGIQADAAQWLADRRSGISQHERACRRRGIHFALWIPALIALSVFLFLPETWGILSHLGPQNSDDLSGYRVRIPATWVILFRWDEQSDGRSSVNGVAGRGIGFGTNPLRFDSLSSWQVQTTSFGQSGMTESDRWHPNESEILGRRALTIGNENLACVDFWPSYDWGPARSEAVVIAHVQCSGTTQFRASFDGRRDQLPEFYQMLNGITKAR